MSKRLTPIPDRFEPVAAPSPIKPKLLVVEDDEPMRMQMRWALADDYEVCQAGDRKTALEMFRKERHWSRSISACPPLLMAWRRDLPRLARFSISIPASR